MSTDLLCDHHELQRLVEEYQPNLHRYDSTPQGIADAVALAILMADRRAGSNAHSVKNDWLTPYQLGYRHHHEVSVPNESFRNTEKGRVVIVTDLKSHVLIEVWPLYGNSRHEWGGGECPVPDCGRKAGVEGLCVTHRKSRYEHPHLWCAFQGCGNRDLYPDPVDEDLKTSWIDGQRTRVRTDVRFCRDHHARLVTDREGEWLRVGGREYRITNDRKKKSGPKGLRARRRAA